VSDFNSFQAELQLLQTGKVADVRGFERRYAFSYNPARSIRLRSGYCLCRAFHSRSFPDSQSV
jgi:hypothetical protein